MKPTFITLPDENNTRINPSLITSYGDGLEVTEGPGRGRFVMWVSFSGMESSDCLRLEFMKEEDRDIALHVLDHHGAQPETVAEETLLEVRGKVLDRLRSGGDFCECHKTLIDVAHLLGSNGDTTWEKVSGDGFPEWPNQEFRLLAKIKEEVIAGLSVPTAENKQWFLERAAKLLGINLLMFKSGAKP